MFASKFTEPRFHSPTFYQNEVGDDDRFACLRGDYQTDVVVIGAGLAGLSSARGLAERGNCDVIVIDRGLPGEGASGRNGGFVFAGYSLDNDALARRVGVATARRMHGWTRTAVDLVRSRCRQLDVPVSSQGVLLADWFGQPETMAEFQRRMRELLDFRLDWANERERAALVRSDRYGVGLIEPGSFHFNPLAYVRAIAAKLVDVGITVAAGSPAIEMKPVSSRKGGWIVRTPQAVIRAHRVVVATGGYGSGLWPAAGRAVQPIATYIMVTEPIAALAELMPADVAVYDNRFAFDYYRKVGGDRLLWGGRISITDRGLESIRRMLRRDMLKVFPSLHDCCIDYTWGGWMSYARHQMPVLTETQPGLWLALAFGGHGMATTTLAGEVLAEALCGEPLRLREFQRFGPVWAGSTVGRAALQSIYWWKQLRDRLR
ncbi:MAG: FAD-binding oxidoreductase [Xanthomonadaceae bacterium]|nr:FAD-binding oxidoreductase [Xanthomonadaceae bacterium]